MLRCTQCKDGLYGKYPLLGALGLTIVLRLILLMVALSSPGNPDMLAPGTAGYMTGVRLATERGTSVGIINPDTNSYVAPLNNLVHGSFSTTTDGPELNRTPGYSIFLLVTGLGGIHPLVWVAFQILLACFSAFLVFEIAMLLYRREIIAFLCAVLYAVEPTSILYTVQLFSDTLFTLTLLVFFYYIVKYTQEPLWISLVWSALTLVAAVYVKPVAYYLPLFCAIGFILVPTSIKLRPRLLRAASFLAICAVFIGAWQVRNYIETGYSGFTSLSDRQIYMFNAGAVVAQKEHVDFLTELHKLGGADPSVYYARHPEQENWPIPQQLAYQKHEAIRIIRENPFLFMKLHVKGMISVLLHPSVSDFLSTAGLPSSKSVSVLNLSVDKRGVMSTLVWMFTNNPTMLLVTVALEGILLIYYGLAIYGFTSLHTYRNGSIALVLIGLYFIAVAGGPAGGARYRCPVMPIIALLAGAGLAGLMRSRLTLHDIALSEASKVKPTNAM